mgnify:FL=1|jgi:hypothetical protein
MRVITFGLLCLAGVSADLGNTIAKTETEREEESAPLIDLPVATDVGSTRAKYVPSKS